MQLHLFDIRILAPQNLALFNHVIRLNEPFLDDAEFHKRRFVRTGRNGSRKQRLLGIVTGIIGAGKRQYTQHRRRDDAPSHPFGKYHVSQFPR